MVVVPVHLCRTIPGYHGFHKTLLNVILGYIGGGRVQSRFSFPRLVSKSPRDSFAALQWVEDIHENFPLRQQKQVYYNLQAKIVRKNYLHHFEKELFILHCWTDLTKHS